MFADSMSVSPGRHASPGLLDSPEPGAFPPVYRPYSLQPSVVPSPPSLGVGISSNAALGPRSSSQPPRRAGAVGKQLSCTVLEWGIKELAEGRETAPNSLTVAGAPSEASEACDLAAAKSYCESDSLSLHSARSLIFDRQMRRSTTASASACPKLRATCIARACSKRPSRKSCLVLLHWPCALQYGARCGRSEAQDEAEEIISRCGRRSTTNGLWALSKWTPRPSTFAWVPCWISLASKSVSISRTFARRSRLLTWPPDVQMEQHGAGAGYSSLSICDLYITSILGPSPLPYSPLLTPEANIHFRQFALADVLRAVALNRRSLFNFAGGAAPYTLPAILLDGDFISGDQDLMRGVPVHLALCIAAACNLAQDEATMDPGQFLGQATLIERAVEGWQATSSVESEEEEQLFHRATAEMWRHVRTAQHSSLRLQLTFSLLYRPRSSTSERPSFTSALSTPRSGTRSNSSFHLALVAMVPTVPSLLMCTGCPQARCSSGHSHGSCPTPSLCFLHRG